jgi:carbamoyltransferase
MRVGAIKEVTDVYVTHWAIDGKLDSMGPKHWQPSELPLHKNIISLNPSTTHHDTHAYAAWWYAMAKPGLRSEDTMLFVIDGFGNFGEHISIYKCSGWGPKLIRRFFGYDGSLGLMYQYMTAFMGMKQHEDEYKILGYETHIEDIDLDHGLLQRRIDAEISYYLDSYFDSKKLISDYDPMVRLDALPALQHRMNQRWLKLGRELSLDIVDNVLMPTFENRVVMSYYVQSILEGVVHGLMQIYRPVNVIGSGGVFYNVKLNRKILNWIPGKLCVYPLAGDQGNALGLFAIGNDLQWPGHLNWGIRPIRRNTGNLIEKPSGMVHSNDSDFVADVCSIKLKENHMVNLVRGAMEFGPRALGARSIIGDPRNEEMQKKLNLKINYRESFRPFDPSVLAEDAKDYFEL